MSRANRHFCKIIFAAGVLFGLSVPSMGTSVTYQAAAPRTSLAGLRGPYGHVSSNWVGNTIGAPRFLCCKSNGGYWNVHHVFKPKPHPHPHPHPHPGPVGVADGDPSSLVLLSIGLASLLVTSTVTRMRKRT